MRPDANRASKPQPRQSRIDPVTTAVGIITERLSIFKQVYADLIALQREEDEDDYIYKPTNYAFGTAERLLLIAYLSVNSDIPRPAITPDGEGGLRLEWRVPDREVRLICPAQPHRQPYIYYEADDNYKVVENVEGKTLAFWLTWLNNA